ncbi:MAG: hypothetical protein HW412_1531 [Bacteroidetes bacterium]|nr:hypothetical protein [Bacteroidota bacterium]
MIIGTRCEQKSVSSALMGTVMAIVGSPALMRADSALTFLASLKRFFRCKVK